MLGRAAYHDPYVLAAAETQLFGDPPPSRARIVQTMFEYACEEVARGTSLRAIARHMLGLYHGQPNARLWRRMLSDAAMLAANRAELLLQAMHATEAAQAEIAAMA
jgi:tRNA-dihydrouridine synthase A